jgi:hypothetical protein
MDVREEFQKRHDEYQKQRLASHIHSSRRNKRQKKHPLNLFYIIGGILAILLVLPLLLKISQM